MVLPRDQADHSSKAEASTDACWLRTDKDHCRSMALVMAGALSQCAARRRPTPVHN